MEHCRWYEVSRQSLYSCYIGQIKVFFFVWSFARLILSWHSSIFFFIQVKCPSDNDKKVKVTRLSPEVRKNILLGIKPEGLACAGCLDNQVPAVYSGEVHHLSATLI